MKTLWFASIWINLNVTMKIRKNFESYSRKLFELVNDVSKFTTLIEFDVKIIFWEINVNFAIDIFVKKNRFDVHLFQFLFENNDENENNFVIHEFHYKNESFIVIETFSLFEIANDSTSFVTNNFVVEFFFSLKIICCWELCHELSD